MARPSTAAVKTHLNNLERVYVDALARTVQIQQTFQVSPSTSLNNATHAYNLAQLRDEATKAITTHAAAADAAFTALISASDDHVNGLKQNETQTTDYAAFLSEMTAMGALLPFLSEQAAVDRLQSALSDGRMPQARALYELLSARFPMGQRDQDRPTNIAMVLYRASLVIVPANIEEAEGFAADMRLVYRAYRLAATDKFDRLEAVLGATPWQPGDTRAGWYSPRFLFGSGSPYIAD